VQRQRAALTRASTASINSGSFLARTSNVRNARRSGGRDETSMTMRAFLVGALAAIAALTLPVAPGDAQTGPAATGPVPAAMILNAAERVYSRDILQARAKGALNASSRHDSIVRGVLQPVVAGVGTLYPQTGNWSWAISVETRDEPVAYCLPGGKILVSTGLIDRPGLTPPRTGRCARARGRPCHRRR
jgi:hypothetical protein